MNSNTMNLFKSKNTLQVLIHFIAWSIVFSLPFIIFGKDTDIDIWDKMLHHTIVIFSMLLVFYLNYFILINRFLFQKKIVKFLIYNLLLVTFVAIIVHLWQEATMPPLPIGEKIPQGIIPSRISFLIRDTITLLVIAILSTAIKTTAKWYTAETEHQESEKRRTEAELMNLRQQINPHFLFNTLNNIYALIAINPDNAQTVVHDLSKLLRYVLYENSGERVTLQKELEFILNYVALMRIRLADDVDVDLKINIPAENNFSIAPMLFISLIENAFKHGVSPNRKSFIHIDFSLTNNNKLKCSISNSYFPKTESDMAGSGIGLENLQKRLYLLYPDNYEFYTGELNGIYYSKIILPLQPDEKV